MLKLYIFDDRMENKKIITTASSLFNTKKKKN